MARIARGIDSARRLVSESVVVVVVVAVLLLLVATPATARIAKTINLYQKGIKSSSPAKHTDEVPPIVSKLSFYTVSDAHLGWDPVIQPICNSSYTSNELNRIVVEDINHLPGSVQWPDAMGGGTVEEPVGVIMTGDLVDRGPEAIGYPQWTNYTNLFGLTGEGLLNYPVYEGYGNHDGGNLTSGKDYPNFVRLGMKARNKMRKGITHLSDNELHYSWDWPVSESCSVHFIMLSLFPGSYGDKVKDAFYGPNPGCWFRPEYSIDFLKHDLKEKVGNSGRPVVIFQHYGFDGFSNLWWSDHEREELARVLKPYNILLIFVGHTHVANYYQWSGFDVINTPCTQGDAAWNGPPDPQFMIVDIATDDGGKTGTVRVAQRKRYAWGPISFMKTATLCPAGPYVSSSASAEDANTIKNLMMEWPPAPILGGALNADEMECESCEWL